MDNSPAFRVLVVVPTLGQRMATLERTLSSLRTQANVTVDIVLVSPAFGDALRSTASRFEASLVEESGHISAAINRGFSTSAPEHRYVAWIGDDDMIPTGALARSVAQLERSPDAVLCFGDCEYVDSEGLTMFTRRPPPCAGWLMQFVPGLIKSETCLFRRSAVSSVGGLDEKLRYAMDLDLILRLRAVGRFVRCRAPQGVFCWHPGSITVANRECSFTEAQAAQRWGSRGLTRYIVPLAQPLLKRLFLMISRRIDRQHAGTV